MGLQGAGGVKSFSVGICDGAQSTAHSSLSLCLPLILFNLAIINNARCAGPCQGVKRAVTETLLGAERKSDVSAWEPPRQQTTQNKGADLISTFSVHSLESIIDKLATRRISAF